MEEMDTKPVFDNENLLTNAKIKVIGVGGGGSNAVNQMIHDKSDLVEYWVVNTDCQALANSPCENKYVLGKNITRGLGAGGDPEMGKKAADDSFKDIQLLVKGADLVFIAAGEGGGTGTGAAPVIAKAAKDNGSLVLAIVTRPFNFEGKGRRLNALEGINELKKNVDALIVVSNDKLVFTNGSMSVKDAFSTSDEVLAQSVKTITDLILVHGLINLDFADVKSTLANRGVSLIGIGYGEGEEKTIKAAQNAINSPLLESSIKGARSMIINVTVGEDTTLDEIQYAINFITEAASGDENEVNIIFGVQSDDSFHNKVKIAIIATDFAKEIDFSKETKPLPRTQVSLEPEENTSSSLAKKADFEIEKKKNFSPLPDYLRSIMKEEEEKKPKDVVKENVSNVQKDIAVSSNLKDVPVKDKPSEKKIETRMKPVSDEEDDVYVIPLDQD